MLVTKENVLSILVAHNLQRNYGECAWTMNTNNTFPVWRYWLR